MKVLVQFFKPYGKWYTSETIEWQADPGHHTKWKPFDTVLPKDRLLGMVAVCIDSPLGFPVMRPSEDFETHDDFINSVT